MPRNREASVVLAQAQKWVVDVIYFKLLGLSGVIIRHIRMYSKFYLILNPSKWISRHEIKTE